MKQKWTHYITEELDSLAQNRVPLTSREERLCPACGHKSVRSYFHEMSGGARGHPVGMSYIWCANCHKYNSSTGVPRSDRYNFDDPSETDRELARLRRHDLLALLDYLNELWDRGVLPQAFVPKRK